MKRRILAWIMTFMIVFGTMPTNIWQASAAEDSTAASGDPLYKVTNPDAKSTDETGGIYLDKKLSALDNNGEGTITLETYVTGTVHTETVPVDIVMVLDMSTSMKDDFSESYYEYEEVYSGELNQKSTYYVKNGSSYKAVTYCDTCKAWTDGCYHSKYYNKKGEIYTPKTSATSSNGTQFYSRTTVEAMSRLDALKSSAENFVDSIADRNEGHRIAIVGFHDNGVYLSGTDASNSFKDATSNESTLKGAITGIETSDLKGATDHNDGLQLAEEILKADTQTDRNKVVILFTDGEPEPLNSGDWSSEIVKGAVNSAYNLKNTHNAQVYVISVLPNADPTSTTSNMDKYMNYVSSNYPSAQYTGSYSGKNESSIISAITPGSGTYGDKYYQAASDFEGLEGIFESITDDVQNIALDENTIIRDVMSEYFEANIPEDADLSGIKVYESDYLGNGDFETKEQAALINHTADSSGYTVSVENGVVSVNGFDFEPVIEEGPDGQPHGKKLIIEIPVKIKADQQIAENPANSGKKINSNNTVEIKSAVTNTTSTWEFNTPNVDFPVWIEGEKTWVDGDNQYDTRPENITVKLLADGEEIETKVVTATNSWKYSFGAYPKYNEEGKEISYTVVETAVPGYEAPVYDGFNITNKLDSVDTSVEKIWDTNGFDSKVPESLSVTLQKKVGDNEPQNVTVVTLNEENDWKATINDLPKYSGADEIMYSWVEMTPEGFTQTGNTTTDNVTTITNELVTTIDVPVEKEWVGSELEEKLRPESIKVQLYADGTPVGDAVTITADENGDWTYTFEDVNKYDEDGNLIKYTVKEVGKLPNGYTSTVDGNIITNTFKAPTVNLEGTKEWIDANDQDGIRPDNVTLHVLADGVDTGKTIEVTAGDDKTWDPVDLEWEIKNLPYYSEDGRVITYTITEDAVEGYTSKIEGDQAEGFEVTNTHTPETTKVEGTKKWNDNNDDAGMRPDEITVQLMANDKPYGEAKTLTKDNWTYLWENLPKYAAGKEIKWTVVETSNVLDDNYSTVPGDKDNNFTVTNTYPAVRDITVVKDWKDKENQDGIRPDDVTVQLYADGTAYGEPVTLEADNEWSYTWTNLFVNKNTETGFEEIEYTVKEQSVPAGYTVDYSAIVDGKITVINTHTPAVTTATVKKVWKDNNNQDGIRPGSISVQLLADGENYGSPVTLEGTGNEWTYTWENLPQKAAGKDIVYTVAEITTVEGYETSVEGNVITNTHTPETTEVSIEKVWVDNDDQDGKRPESIKVQLYANGTATGDPVELTKKLTHTWTNLPKYANGIEIVYTADEVEVPADYTKEVTGNAADGFVITNTHEIEKISVSGSKTWADAENQDGVRPESIVIHLNANGEEVPGKTVTVTAADGWKWSFTDLDKYTNGEEIVYTVSENAVPGYAPDYDGMNVTNTHKTEETEVTVTKEWDDNNNQDGKRMSSVQVQLYADGTAKGVPVTLNEDNNWTYTWEKLDKMAAGKVINYTVDEVTVPEGYTKKVVENPENSDKFTITNKHEIEKVSVSGSKTWDDDDNQDGKRPTSITINLLADGKVEESKTVTAADNWAWTFTGLDKYKDGKEIVYTITEDEVAEYTTEIKGFNVTNKHEIEKTSVSGSKTWDDDDNQDGKRPTSITIKLLANGTEVDSKTVTATDGWSWTFTGLDKYANGKEIIYTVQENAIEGYTPDGVADMNVTNSYEPEKTSVSGAKTWEDAENQDGKRPTSITINLLADGKVKESKTVTAKDGWAWTFTGLDKYANGKEIVYTITEDEVAEYTTEIKGFNVTNKHEIEKTSVNGAKTWVDNDDQDGKRPEDVTIRLYADGEEVRSATVTEKDGWKWSFTNLPKYRDGGVEIVYTITEDEVAEYTTEIKGFNVTNTHEIEKTSVSGAKTWVDDDNRDGLRPESITINLLADGKVKESKTVTAKDGWAWTFIGLDKYANGKEIVYTITEDEVAEYTTEIKGFNVTNKHEIEKTSVSGEKTWSDDNDRDGLRPESIKINLLADGEVVDSKTVTAADDWKWFFTDLPKKAAGKDIAYTVVEETVDGYTTTVDGFDVTNTHEIEKTSVSGSKTWNDDNNRDGLRPNEITINLLADGKVVDSKTVTAADGWKWSFTDLPMNKNTDGKISAIVYAIEEADVPEYAESIDGYNVVNTHTPEKTSVSGTKTWSDADNQDGKRPASVTIRLHADGTEIATATASAESGWKYEFTDLNKYRDAGTEIVYTVTEDAVTDYTTTTDDSKLNFTNSYRPGETSVTVTKAWDDAGDQDGLRPEKVTVNLLADGEVAQTVELDAAKQWTHTWNGLAQKKAGKDIVYTVEEVGKIEGYIAPVITGTAASGYVITNTHTPATTEIAGAKTWDDDNNRDGIRPENITINLLADGEQVRTATVTADNNWAYEFTNLPVYKNHGTPIVYTVAETPVEGYTPTINGFDVTNTHSPEKVNVEGTKTWDDADNQDGVRPTSITVNLLADGVEEAEQTVTPTADGNWKYSFTDLYKYKNGKEIVYTISEDTVKDYTGAITGTHLINDHDPAITEITGTKTWNDSDNQDGKRPESITINLLADGVEVDEQIVTAENGWKYSFANLPVFEAGKVGHVIKYTITEDEVSEYTTAYPENTYDVINTHEPEMVAISGVKTWDDADNQDGFRPESITINLLADGEEIDESTVTPDAEGNWTYDFGNLPKYKVGEEGQEIVYTITEDAVENYTTNISGFNVTNKHVPETVEVSGSKTWADADNQDGKRPESITVRLFANGEEIDSVTVTPNEEGNWKYNFTDLDKYEGGKEIAYTVMEDAVEDYTTSINGYDITNTYAPEQTSVNGVKTWQDGNDQDGVRPESITIRLLADGKEVAQKTVTKDDNWAWSFTDLPKFRDGGQEIVYTITEDAVDEYTTEINGFNVTNTRTPEQIEISGSKTWEDAKNQDGKRPQSITVRLLADGTEVAQKTVTEDDRWAWMFTELPKYKAGTEIVYTITEDEVDEYTTEIDGFDVTNTHEIELIDLSGTKTWDDADNQDGKRPQSITIRLLADGEEIRVVTANEASDWKYEFKDLPKYREGKVGEEIVYTITEDAVAEYTTAINGFNVTNTHIPETVVVEGTKTWNDADNQDGVRPESVTVNLLADGKEIAEKVVSAANSWSYQFKDLPKYEDGKIITYTVTEDAISGYNPDENAADFNIENRHTPAQTSVTVSKVWRDANNQDGARPASVTVRLLADGAEIRHAELNETNNWTHTWTELDEKSSGKDIVYTVTEDAVEKYTTEITGNATDGYTVTNTHTPAVVTLSGEKTWADADNQDGIRPKSITINLLANGIQVDTVTVGEAEGWDWSFENKPEYANGEKIVYVIQEVVIDDYTTSITEYDVTNTHIPETTSVHVAKNWNDDGDRDGIRPDKITYNLLADGNVVNTKTVTAADKWAAEFTELPVYRDGGIEIVYTVEELEVEGYTTTYVENNENNFTVSNTHEPEKTSVKGKKSWRDRFDQDGKRPDAITVYLYANGERVDSKEVTADDDWKYEFTNLNKNDAGKEIKYTVVEEAVPNYTSEVDGFDITNRYEPETVDISGTKTWVDADDQDGKRPESITVRLLADGKEVASKVVTEAHGWAYTFEGMAKYKNGGKLITYTISEDKVAEYTTEIDGFNVTNIHTPETTKVEGTKTWADEGDQDGKRPESITINLLANGEKVDSVTVDADDDWSWSFTDLPKYEAGKLINYAVAEVAIGDYSTEITNHDVTNTHTPAQTSVSVSKAWDDADNQDGIRPASVKVQLLADGETVANAELNADNSWAYTWSGLDMYNDGETIDYTVREVDAPAGYEVSCEGDAANGYVITNKHKPATVVIDGTKTWADVDDQDGKRPEAITVLLLANGVQIDSVTISEENDWEWAFADLPKFEDGNEIDYQIEEVIIPDYETNIDQITGEITNRHDPELTFVQVAKSWQDNHNQDGIRPDKIRVNLLADGKLVDSKYMTAADEWTTQFTNLPKYKDGELIKYTITEDAVKGYETSYVEYKDYQVIVNTHEPETTKVEGIKTWEDNNDQDGIRPDEITVNLYADGEKVDSATVTGEAGWTYSFDNLPKFKAGKEIIYTVDEVPVKGYEKTIDGFNITNSHDNERINIKGTKHWADEDDQDGKRPESITVQLRVNGQVYDSQVVTAEDNWTYEWKGLSKYYNGVEVKYMITETPIPGYTASHDGYDITNSYVPGVVSVHVTKGWKDLNNLDGIRPDSVDVELFANGVTTGKTITLNQGNGWHGAFRDLDEYADGEKIEYTVKEVGVAEGYTSTVTGSAEEGFTVLNTHDPEQIEIKGTKTWDDADDQDGKRPESIKVKLLANGSLVDTKVVTAEDNWTYNFGELNKYYNSGKEIKYEIVEESVEGYTATVDGLDITNTHEPEMTEISGAKTWDDNFDQDGKRPDEITVKLLANGEITESVKVTEADGWSWTFENLPVYADGEMIEYEVIEGGIDGYEADVEGFDITNAHEPETTEISGSKTWDDADDQDGIRPEEIKVRLLADGKPVAADVASEDNNWTWFFEDLPVYDDGELIKYTVEEETVDGYESVVNGFDITNIHKPETTVIEGTKTWDDADNQDGIRPEVITINLLADGKVVETAKVTVANAWTWTFKDMPVYEDGEKINYTIEEESVEGYTSVYDGFNVTNTHEPATVDVEGSKTWDDADNQDGIRPDEIKVRLLADGTQIDAIKITAADNWSWSFKDLPQYKDGKEIVYTITEDAVENYGPSIDGFDITNAYTPEQTSVTVTKAWDDADNQDGVRSEFVEVQLYADGKAYDAPKVLYAENNWTYTWTELNMNSAGEPIEYTVKELNADEDGYTCEITGDAVKGYIITNTHKPETIDIDGTKTWIDDDDKAGSRPESIVISLLADGTVVDAVTVTAEDDWAYEFTDAAKFKDGKEITYTIEETPVAGYVSEVKGFDVINTAKTPAAAAIGGVKVLKNAELEEGQFEFGLYNEADELIGTAVNGADGTFAFEEITYSEEGTFVYFIKEMIPEDAEELEPGTYVVDGISYDTAVYKYTVTVAEEDDSYAVTSEAVQLTDGDILTDCTSVEFTNENIGGGGDDEGDDPGSEEPGDKPVPPTEPEDPKDEPGEVAPEADEDPLTEEDKDGTPQTGDNFNLFFWMMIALAGVFGATGAVKVRRREN